MNKKLWLFLVVLVWVAFVCDISLFYYVNHYFPHGSFYPTGEYIEEGVGKGKEIYEEDLRGLNMPDWAMFFKKYGEILFIVLGVGGVIISSQKPRNKETLAFSEDDKDWI